MKSSRRPNSLISECSLSSGTSSSSLSKSSTSSSSSSAHQQSNSHISHQQLLHHHPNQALELINECQTLALDGSTDSCSRTQQLMTNTMSSGFSSHSGSGVPGTVSSKHRHHHKRSTTIVSQLSMGIELDLCYYF